MDKTSPAQEKFIRYLHKRYPTLSNKEAPMVLNSIKRFVDLTRKIYTEPQAIVKYKDNESNGKKIKDRVFNTTVDEVEKARKKDTDKLLELMRNAHKTFIKKKYG